MRGEVTFVLVHGAWHGGWAWDGFADRLRSEGVGVRVADLPSVGEAGCALGDLHDDAAVVRAAIDECAGPVVVVGRSYGGMVISEAAAGVANVARLVYLAAFMPEAGESLLALAGGSEPDWWLTSEDGLTIRPSDPVRRFYNKCPPAAAAAAASRIRPHNKLSVTQPARAAAWHEIPSTYIVCERDQALPPAAQEAFAQRASAVRRIDTDHSPQLSRPEELLAILRELIPA